MMYSPRKVALSLRPGAGPVFRETRGVGGTCLALLFSRMHYVCDCDAQGNCLPFADFFLKLISNFFH